jgi:kanamycin kinase
MIRTPVTVDPNSYPAPLRPFLQNTRVFDSSCSPEARVLYLEREDCFLKRAAKGMLHTEAQMNAYFHTLGLTAPVLCYLSEGEDFLLTARVAGEDCTHMDHLADPKRLCDTIAAQLRALHELTATDCPVQDRMQTYFASVREGIAKGRFDPDFLPAHLRTLTQREAARLLENAPAHLSSDTLLHGDYCLPNILLDGWRFSGFIDLGNGGIGDRHVDLFWGAWTLGFNLHTDAYRERFFDAYGREAIDKNTLDLIAVAECFG